MIPRSMQAFVRHIFISPGHNFFGRHGLLPGENPSIAVDQVVCRAGRGLEGDRFFDYKEDYRGQVTFFDFAVFDEIRRALQVPQLNPAAFRRNVLVEGLDLVGLIGSQFLLGGVKFEGVAESSPCHWMNHAVAPDAEAWLKGRGGLRAKILTDGVILVGAAEFALVSGQLTLV